MMYNDAEYQKLIRTLSSDIQEDREGPYPIIIKKIPDRDRPGDIDPRALALLQKLSADPGPETIDLTDLAPLRAAMNWKSLDITRMLLNVRHTSFFGRDGNRIRLRVYSPAELTGPLPCILYYHGGGWIGGEMAYVENACKVLAERASAVVVSVEYRFAPEHPFPAGFHDCCDALCHVFSHKDEFNIDPGKIAVSGDSAGGNLAAACALCDRDEGRHMVCCQLLAYPCVNPFSLENDYYTWSYDQYEILHHQADIDSLCIYEIPVQRCMKVCEEAYLQGKPEQRNPYASPLFANNFTGTAPALFIIPEYDYLRLEGEAYARRMAQDGVSVKMIRYRGMGHGFMEKVGQYPQAEDALNEMARFFLQHVE